MHVYANTFRIEGPDAYDISLRTIHGWLREKIGDQIQLSDITRDGEYEHKDGSMNAWLRCSYSGVGTPELFAWRLKHSDAVVKGRQWLIELGLMVEQGAVEFSCSIQTEEQSTLVDNKVEATSPRIIRYFRTNIEKSQSHVALGVPGLAVKQVGADEESYRALRFDIERHNRDYPIVIVSPNRADQYAVDCGRLQEQLFGLAQVVKVDLGFNSYDMEEALGRNWSAWDGAINILHTPFGPARVRNSLMRSEEINELGATHQAKISRLLAIVTHNTNVPRLRKRIRPEGVDRLAFRRRLEARRAQMVKNSSTAIQSEAEMTQLWDEMESLDQQLQQAIEAQESAEMRCMQLEDEKSEIDSQLRQTKYQLREISKFSSAEQQDAELVQSLLKLSCVQDQPSPVEVLETIAAIFPDRCVVLDSAYASAADVGQFESGRRLLDMLRRLMTDYYSAIQEGGDSQARKVFSADEYSATESESVQNNRALRECRVFEYKNEHIEMLRHLKIGKVDDIRKTIRVHFSWMHGERKIVIGHCGEHLPVSSH